MDRRTFHILCEMLRDVAGLRGTRNTPLEEIVAAFLHTLAHHVKNRTIGGFLFRSGETVSRNFNSCLLAVLKLHQLLLKKPEPIPEDCTDFRWKHFKNCLGALDGTHVKMTVPTKLKGRYRSRKGDIVTNVLGVCAPDMQFIYVLPGWEGSAHDGRVLRDAISRPDGLRVPQGCYYLVDAGYTNANGFLAPYRGQRYHLGGFTAQNPPHSAEEYFNLCHARARNIVERSFGRLKGTIFLANTMAQEEATQKDPMQLLQEKSIAELKRLGFTGSEVLKAAAVFVKVPNQMSMLFAIPENLRREFIQNMLADEAQRR